MNLTPELEARLKELCTVFLEENGKLNLSAFRTEETCWNGNILDSISLLDFLPKFTSIPSPLPLSQWERGVPNEMRDGVREAKHKTNPTVLFHARNMRKEPTDAEEILWQKLRDDQLGVHFRRQHPLDGIILDFYCSTEKLCVEVDGPIHEKAEEKEWDKNRQDTIESKGIHVLRFTNQEVLEHIESVLQKIQNNIQQTSSSSHGGGVRGGGNFKILDVGTGGGFPLLPLSICMPDSKFVGVDSTQKKIDAIKRIVDRLHLTNVELLCGRTEELGHDTAHREQYDIVTARAVAELNTLLEFTSPFAKVRGHVVAWKSMNIDQELQDSLLARAEFSCHLIEKYRYTLPGDWGERQLLLFEKSFALKPQYPREVGEPKKNPII